MKNYNSFINEQTNYPKTIELNNIADKMRDEAKKKWFDEIESLFLNKVIKFKGSKWSNKGHRWEYFVITVKKIQKQSSVFDTELTIIDTNNEYYTVLGGNSIKVYNNMLEYEAELNSEKYNL